jgi:quercetin dioxygenase-like cupin family protein
MKIFKNIQPEFIDVRGAIKKILDDGKTSINSILLIDSKAGAIRGNHYHKKDAHYCYLLSGKMEYSEKPSDGGTKESVVLETGDMVYSPPMTIHAFRALEDSVFIALATESRSQEKYEEDTVRVNLVE